MYILLYILKIKGICYHRIGLLEESYLKIDDILQLIKK